MKTIPLWLWLSFAGGTVVLVISLGAASLYRGIENERYQAKKYRHPLTLTIAPDGDTVYFDAVVDDVAIVVSDSRKKWGNALKLIETNARMPRMSEDGKHLYFHRGENEYGDFTEIWRRDLDCEESQVVIRASDFNLPSLSLKEISPDGSLLLVRYPDYIEGGAKSRLFHNSGTPVDQAPTCNQAWFCGDGVVVEDDARLLKFIKLNGYAESIKQFDDYRLKAISRDGTIALLGIEDRGKTTRVYRWKEGKLLTEIKAEFPFLSDDGKFVAYRTSGGVVNGETVIFLVDQEKSINLGKLMELTGWTSTPGGLAYRNVVVIRIFDPKTETLQSYPVRASMLQSLLQTASLQD